MPTIYDDLIPRHNMTPIQELGCVAIGAVGATLMVIAVSIIAVTRWMLSWGDRDEKRS